MTSKKHHAAHFPEIPDLKVHRTGHKRRKRRGVLGMVRPHHAAPVGKPVSAVLASNLGLFGLIAFVAAASAGYGTLRAPEYAQYRSGKSHAAAAGAQLKKTLQYEGDLSDLPGPVARPKDSVGLVWDKTAEQKAADLAAAQARAQAEAQAQAQLEAQAGPVDVADVAGVDLSALTAKPEGRPEEKPEGAPEKPKFGALGQNGAAPRLAGGAGLSGGLGRGFDAPRLKSELGKLSAMRPGTSARTTSSRATTPYKGGGGRSVAARQLGHAVHFSGRAISGNAETNRATAGQAFEGVVAADGKALTGAGAVEGDSPKDGAPPETAAANQAGGPINSPAGYTEPLTEPGVSRDPTDGIISKLKMLLGLASGLLLLQMLLVNTSWTVFGTAAWEINADAIMLVGLGILALGITLATMGRPVLGVMYALVAAGVIAAAWFGTPSAGGTGLLALLGGGVLAGVMPFLDPKDLDGKSWNAKKGNWD